MIRAHWVQLVGCARSWPRNDKNEKKKCACRESSWEGVESMHIKKKKKKAREQYMKKHMRRVHISSFWQARTTGHNSSSWGGWLTKRWVAILLKFPRRRQQWRSQNSEVFPLGSGPAASLRGWGEELRDAKVFAFFPRWWCAARRRDTRGRSPVLVVPAG